MKMSKSSYKGMYSYKNNPMGKPNQVSNKCGPGMNADQNRANRLMQMQAKKEASRGKSGM